MAADDDIDLDNVEINEELPVDAAEAKERSVVPLTVEEADEGIEELKATARAKTVERMAGQLNTIELAARVKTELEPLLSAQNRGAVLEAAVVKLGLDILAGNLQPRNLAEAAKAIEALDSASRLIAGGVENRVMNSGARREVFDQIHAHLHVVASKDSEVPKETIEALEVTSTDQ